MFNGSSISLVHAAVLLGLVPVGLALVEGNLLHRLSPVKALALLGLFAPAPRFLFFVVSVAWAASFLPALSSFLVVLGFSTDAFELGFFAILALASFPFLPVQGHPHRTALVPLGAWGCLGWPPVWP